MRPQKREAIKSEIKTMCFLISSTEVSDYEFIDMSDRDLLDWHTELTIQSKEEAELNASFYDPENWDW